VTHVAEQQRLPDSPPLNVGRISPLGKLFGKLLGLCSRALGNERYDNYRLERVLGMPFLVTPSVFNPKLLRTGQLFASHLNSALIDREWDVLDMGTGSGVCAVFAARHARRVVAVDINAAAVRCAGINARLNGLEHKIELKEGDLFAPVRSERFDLVLFNPPFVRGMPRDDRDRAWRSVDVAERFAADLGQHLKPEGMALVLLSTFGDSNHFLQEFQQRHYRISVFARLHFLNERVTIFKLQAPACPP
jgi:HemK-related putative methylase